MIDFFVKTMYNENRKRETQIVLPDLEKNKPFPLAKAEWFIFIAYVVGKLMLTFTINAIII